MMDDITNIMPTFNDLDTTAKFQLVMSGYRGDSEITNLAVNYVKDCTDIRALNSK
jgi:pyridoxal/pyridoxine/pyridoxamine kinase